jgi:hypothetical protein
MMIFVFQKNDWVMYVFLVVWQVLNWLWSLLLLLYSLDSDLVYQLLQVLHQNFVPMVYKIKLNKQHLVYLQRNIKFVDIYWCLPIRSWDFRRSKNCIRILCTTFWLVDDDDVSRRRIILITSIKLFKTYLTNVHTYPRNVVHEFRLVVRQLNISLELCITLKQTSTDK